MFDICDRLYRRVFDIGRFKVVWVNYQIMTTVAWNVQIMERSAANPIATSSPAMTRGVSTMK